MCVCRIMDFFPKVFEVFGRATHEKEIREKKETFVVLFSYL